MQYVNIYILLTYAINTSITYAGLYSMEGVFQLNHFAPCFFTQQYVVLGDLPFHL